MQTQYLSNDLAIALSGLVITFDYLTQIYKPLRQLWYPAILSSVEYFSKTLHNGFANFGCILHIASTCVRARCSSVVRAFAHGAMGRRIDPSYGEPIELFLVRASNKGCGMCYPVCGMVHIKEPLLLIGKSSLCGGRGFPFSLSEWSLTICLTPHNRR